MFIKNLSDVEEILQILLDNGYEVKISRLNETEEYSIFYNLPLPTEKEN